MKHLPTMRYFQILFRNAEGKNRLTNTISMRAVEGLQPSDCLVHTTQFVRDNLISIWEVAG